jgi:hypothetical protein
MCSQDYLTDFPDEAEIIDGKRGGGTVAICQIASWQVDTAPPLER